MYGRYSECFDLWVLLMRSLTGFLVTFGIILGLCVGGCAAKNMGLLPVKQAAPKAVTK